MPAIACRRWPSWVRTRAEEGQKSQGWDKGERSGRELSHSWVGFTLKGLAAGTCPMALGSTVPWEALPALLGSRDDEKLEAMRGSEPVCSL